ncbi:MAG TPA: 50S ribosomal protein L9 [Planctomycetota bacterium]|nr:50S ribosomal protein L9 [Planctomycetota bacterium]
MPDLEVILQSDVEPVGRMGDVVKVSAGYARNFLLPRRLAVVADGETRKRVDKLRARRVAEEAKRTEEVRAVAARIASLSVSIEAAAGEAGQLYGSVTAREIAVALTKQGVEVSERDVRLEHPLRELGVFPVKIHLHADVSAELKVWVVETKKAAAK